jgi:hypothetical protein
MSDDDFDLGEYMALQKQINRIIRQGEAHQKRMEKQRRKRRAAAFGKTVDAGDQKAMARIIKRNRVSVADKTEENMTSPTDKQRKLVSALVNGASINRAWMVSGFSRKHHPSLQSVLQFPCVRLALTRALEKGMRFNSRLHPKLVQALTEPDCHDVAELM